MKAYLLAISLLVIPSYAMSASFFDDIIEDVAKEIIGPQKITKEKGDDAVAAKEIQVPQIKSAFTPCSQHIVSAGKFDINGNQLGGLCALSEATLSAQMLEYTAKNLRLDEKVDFGWRFLNSKDGLKNLIKLTDESVLNGKNKGLLLIDTKVADEESTLKTVLLLDSVSKKAPSETAFISSLEKKFRAADRTNSLTSGNNFRIALEQKYGVPYKVINGVNFAKVLMVERDNKIAESKKAFKLNTDQASALNQDYIIFVNNRIVEYQNVGNQVVQLFWKNAAGEELIILKDPYDWYTLKLENETLAKTYIEQVKQKFVTFNKEEAKSAPIPKL